jgi:hypothetical protein
MELVTPVSGRTGMEDREKLARSSCVEAGEVEKWRTTVVAGMGFLTCISSRTGTEDKEKLARGG